MDVWVNFKHASKWQAEGIFKCFFPAKPAPSNASTTSSASTSATPANDTISSQGLAESKRIKAGRNVPLLPEEEICALAKRFADAIPEDELSVS